MKTIILASGTGMRMRPHTLNTPKSMLEVPRDSGKPMLETIVEHCAGSGMMHEIVFAVGYKKEQIISHFGRGLSDQYGVDMVYSEGDNTPNTAGEIGKGYEHLKDEEDFLVYYGDTITDLNLKEFYDCHKANGKIVTIPAMYSVPTYAGIMKCKPDGTVTMAEEKPFINRHVPLVDPETGETIYTNVPIFWVSRRLFDECSVFKERNEPGPYGSIRAYGRDFTADAVPELTDKRQVHAYIPKGIDLGGGKMDDSIFHFDIGDEKKWDAASKAIKDHTEHILIKLA